MKKFMLLVCMALASLCASAQQGNMAAGVSIGVAPLVDGGSTAFGFGAKFQYNITDPIRLEANLEHWLPAGGLHVTDFYFNGHYLFNAIDRLRVFPLVGLGYAHIGYKTSSGYYDHGDTDTEWAENHGDVGARRRIVSRSDSGDNTYSSSCSRILINFGAGAEYDITDRLAANIELKYQVMKNFSRFPITVGVTYRF